MPLDGVLLVDKPEGPTSHDIVALVRRALSVERVGHAGTLDPLATGLLVLMLGRATRLAGLLSGMSKTYRGTLVLGVETDTYDRAGAPEGPAREVRAGRADIEAAFTRFHGTIRQVPPIYSAKKIRGTPMYRLARRRRPVAPVAAMVTFHRLTLIAVTGARVEFEAEVSAGTYLRSFAHDLGSVLGCGAHLNDLRRTSVGPFDVTSTETPATITAGGAAGRVIPMEEIPLGLPTLVLTAAGSHAILHGRPCRLSEVSDPRPPVPPGRCRLKGPEGSLLGIGEIVIQAPAEAGPIVRPQIVFPG